MTHLFRTLACVSIGLMLAAAPGRAGAWGMQAHEAIATAAGTALTPAAREKIDRLLALEPGSTLASISSWADEHRSPMTARWHYVNFPQGSCTYDEARDCADGACVIEAAVRQIDLLGTNADPRAQLTALKYIVHLVADVHQPLHAGRADDKGGNTYQIQAYGRGTNLHALWDTALVRRIEPDTERLAAQLAKRITTPASMADALLNMSMVHARRSPARWYRPRRFILAVGSMWPMNVMQRRSWSIGWEWPPHAWLPS